MDTRFSDEQAALLRTASELTAKLAPSSVADLHDAERAARLAEAMRSAGWLELRDHDGDGGPVASGVEVGIVARALGRSLADAPFVGPTLAADLARLAGTAGGSEPEHTVLLADDLHGLPQASDTELHDPAVAIDAMGARRALVPVTSDGTNRVASTELGAVADCADLTRRVVRCPAGTALRLDSSRAIDDADLDRWCALALATTANDLVGVMEGALALAVDYARERRQFDQPIGSFQAVQHLLAEAKVLVEGSISVALHASWAVDALDASAARAAGSVAKIYCSRAARDVCETAIQVHGGIGNTWECLAHVYLRRALFSTELFGGDGVHLNALVTERMGFTDGLR